ncbi:ATP-binding cassette domain-containing protein [Saccharicrinis sp. FJH54]|uniref:ATP-binding cassette domain-containing protein n=1 Tax=Saccharicrinis sp. FJH54 TaxID=3344665 RepID=UPI0035D412DC
MDITVENVTKVYGSQKAVDNISFKVHTGEVLGFLGPNGAGKTTTMKAITCYLTPNQGTIKVGGYSVNDQADEVKKRIGYLPENNPLYLEMGVIDYLKFVAELQGVEKPGINDRVREMIRVCGLSHEKHKKIGELSKGYRQRVGLAQALIHDPDVLILDEPTTGLDPNQIVEIRELIRQIGKEKTVILSSHILAEVEATCDRILIINNGKIVADGTAESLRKQAQGNEVIKVCIDEGKKNEVFKALKELPSVQVCDYYPNDEHAFEIQSKPDMSSRKAIFNLCVENGWILTEMTPIETKLEDVFREVTMN